MIFDMNEISTSIDSFSSIKYAEKVVHLALPIAFVSNENAGVIEILDSWIRQYKPQLEGILVSYSNVSLLSRQNKIVGDKLCLLVDVKAKFQLFCPNVGDIVVGKINRISKEHVGCLVHETINVVIKLTEYFPDELHKFMRLEKEILFEITHFGCRRKEIIVKGKITPHCLKLMHELYPVIEEDVETSFSFHNQNTITRYDLKCERESSSDEELPELKKEENKLRYEKDKELSENRIGTEEDVGTSFSFHNENTISHDDLPHKRYFSTSDEELPKKKKIKKEEKKSKSKKDKELSENKICTEEDVELSFPFHNQNTISLNNLKRNRESSMSDEELPKKKKRKTEEKKSRSKKDKKLNNLKAGTEEDEGTSLSIHSQNVISHNDLKCDRDSPALDQELPKKKKKKKKEEKKLKSKKDRKLGKKKTGTVASGEVFKKSKKLPKKHSKKSEKNKDKKLKKKKHAKKSKDVVHNNIKIKSEF